jgi:exoribonuclease R
VRTARPDDEKVLVPRARQREGELAATLARIRDDLDVPEGFPAEVEREALAVTAPPSLPSVDLTALPFSTIDPAGATDLDQAFHIERRGDGFVVRYAIADLPAFVPPNGAIDGEARRRGQTLYTPGGRVPLHPVAISEGAASLLPDVERGAFVWRFELDGGGEVTATDLERARVRSRRQYDYLGAQRSLDAGEGDEQLLLLRAVGVARVAVEQRRGGASLRRPDEEIEVEAGRYRLVRRAPLPVEEWSAQLSLMTGMAAARIMLDGGVGVLRTMPPATDETLARFRRQVAALGCPWPESMTYGAFLRTIDIETAAGLAAMHAAATLFRGAGYAAFDGQPPAVVIQSAIAAPYAHATAPLRRLVDRFVLVTCEALVAGREVPTWVREALPELPSLMGASAARASRLEHEAVDAIEAALLVPHVGEVFDAVVIASNGSSATIQVADREDGRLDGAGIVVSSIPEALEPGSVVAVRLEEAHIPTGTVRFALVS